MNEMSEPTLPSGVELTLPSGPNESVRRLAATRTVATLHARAQEQAQHQQQQQQQQANAPRWDAR